MLIDLVPTKIPTIDRVWKWGLAPSLAIDGRDGVERQKCSALRHRRARISPSIVQGQEDRRQQPPLGVTADRSRSAAIIPKYRYLSLARYLGMDLEHARRGAHPLRSNVGASPKRGKVGSVKQRFLTELDVSEVASFERCVE